MKCINDDEERHKIKHTYASASAFRLNVGFGTESEDTIKLKINHCDSVLCDKFCICKVNEFPTIHAKIRAAVVVILGNCSRILVVLAFYGIELLQTVLIMIFFSIYRWISKIAYNPNGMFLLHFLSVFVSVDSVWIFGYKHCFNSKTKKNPLSLAADSHLIAKILNQKAAINVQINSQTPPDPKATRFENCGEKISHKNSKCT